MIETQCETQCSNLKALEALPAFTSNLIKRLKTGKVDGRGERGLGRAAGRVRGASLKNTRRSRRVSLQEKT